MTVEEALAKIDEIQASNAIEVEDAMRRCGGTEEEIQFWLDKYRAGMAEARQRILAAAQRALRYDAPMSVH